MYSTSLPSSTLLNGSLPPAVVGDKEAEDEMLVLKTADPSTALESATADAASALLVATTTPWALRPTALNDRLLRDAFSALLSASKDCPPEERLIMYDANDLPAELSAPLAIGVRKRLDPRRNTKPKKPDAQLLVCTPFDPDGFNFSKIRNPGEVMLELDLNGAVYRVLTNKFPLFANHMLLVAESLVPQQMTLPHLRCLVELLQATTFCAYFNSWCASASVNHFHCHLIDEPPPVTELPLTPGPLVDGVRCLIPVGYPGFCYVFIASQHVGLVGELVQAMQDENQPHNLLVTPQYIYVWPKPHIRPNRSFELYPETVGGPELIGSWTVYQQSTFESLSVESIVELVRINTAPLPSRVLHRETAPGSGLDDAALTSTSTSAAAPDATEAPTAEPAFSLLLGRAAVPRLEADDSPKPGRPIPSSKSVDLWQLPSMLPRRPPAASSQRAWSRRRRDAGAGRS